MMPGGKWYLVAYDVRCPKRLRRVHREVVSEGQGLQQSVYLVRASHRSLRDLLARVEAHMDTAVDDLRAYPVPHPAQLWCGGVMVTATAERNEPIAAVVDWWDGVTERIRRWRASA